MSVLVGTSGWVYRDWAGRFYPQGLPPRRWLEHYAADFPTVEVNGTFYGLPSLKTVAGWRERVPDSFQFVVKGSRFITHLKRLANLGDAVTRLFERLTPLGPTLAVVLWQLPPTMRQDDEQLARLDRFLGELPTGPRYAVEFRHASWQNEAGFDVLARHDAMVVNVSGPQLPADTTVVGDRVYVRFHGLRPGYRYKYTLADLRPWAEHLRRHGDGYAFFNNDAGGHAVDNAKTLTRLLAGRAR
jgi:uncharacterized protein YecE (DUF72 family)